MPIPTYDEWKRETHQTRFGFQTGEFKKLDAALKKYDDIKSEANKDALKTALENWKAKDKKGFDWKTSMRNETGMIQKLHDALNPYRTAPQGWVAPALPDQPKPGDIYLAQSFEYANSKQRVDVPKAFERAKLLVNSAYLGMAMAGNSTSPERAIYTKWFGAFDQGRLQRVKKIINDVHGALFLKGVVLYYRGPGCQGPSDCAAETGDIAEEDFFGAAWTPANLPATLDKKFTYIFLGSSFFESGEYAQDSIAGVIIHELTHAICGTDDVVYKGVQTYGPALCDRLARERPDLAINNADTYEYLCENFQNRNYIPKPKVINLPPKASITLDMRAPK